MPAHHSLHVVAAVVFIAALLHGIEGSAPLVATHREAAVEFMKNYPHTYQAHDKAGWLALFAENGEVNDPVGTPPAVGHEKLSGFWDAFIGPNHLYFDIRTEDVYDYNVGGDGLVTVTRNAVVEAYNLGLGESYVTKVPLMIRYKIDIEASQLVSLNAFWSLPKSFGAIRSMGAKGLSVAAAQTKSMMSGLGLAGMLRYVKDGMRSAGEKGEGVARSAVEAINNNDRAAFAALLDEKVELNVPGRSAVGAGATLEEFDGLVAHQHKYIVNTVHVSGYSVVLLGERCEANESAKTLCNWIVTLGASGTTVESIHLYNNSA